MSRRVKELQAAFAARAEDVPGSSISWAYVEDGHQHSGMEGRGRVPGFQIGPVTKTLTATVLSRLTQKGLVQLDDPIGLYLPAEVAAAPEVRAITLLELATHTSGLPKIPGQLSAQELFDPYAGFGVHELYQYLANLTPAKLIGRGEFTYSSVGVGLLGHVLSLVSGSSFEALLQIEVLRPFGMEQSFLLAPDANPPIGLWGFELTGARRRPWLFDVMAPSGAVISTASDLIRFARFAIEDRGDLGISARAAMKPMRARRRDVHVGLCWMCRDGLRWHAGLTGAHSAMLMLDTNSRRAIAALWNAPSSLEDICFAAFGGNLAKVFPFEASLTESEVKAYTGDYETDAGKVSVLQNGRRLILRSFLTGDLMLTPSAKGSFFSRDPAFTVLFEPAGDGSGIGMKIRFEGVTLAQGSRIHEN